MFIRIITLPVQPDRIDEAVKMFKDTIAPMFQQQKGLKAGYLVGDRKSGKMESVTLWETEAAASALDASGFYDQWTAKLNPLLTGTAGREQNEVFFQF